MNLTMRWVGAAAALALLLITACTSADAVDDAAGGAGEPQDAPAVARPGDVAPTPSTEPIAYEPEKPVTDLPLGIVAPALPPEERPSRTPGQIDVDPGLPPGGGIDPNGPAVSRPARPRGPISDPDAPVSSPGIDVIVPEGPLPSDPSLSAPISAPPGYQIVEAPIDGLDVLVRESFPVQYALHVKAGLPGGCAKPAGHEVSREGTEITVRVLNTIPSGPVACTMIYGMYELNIGLGSDFRSGTTYTVFVNGNTISFTAQ